MPDDSTRDTTPLNTAPLDHLHCLLCPRVLDVEGTYHGVLETVVVGEGAERLQVQVMRPLCDTCHEILERQQRVRAVNGGGKKPRLIVPRGRD